jgi:uncharacterized membrane protein YkoI
MSRLSKKTTAVLVAVAALGVGGAQVVGSASARKTSRSATTTTGHRTSTETEVTGAAAASVKAAVLAKLPGATVQRVSTEDDGVATDKYEAFVTKADGTHAKVLLNAAFEVTAVQTDNHRGHGRRGPGGPGGSREPVLTGDTLTKVKAAVEAKLPGSTVNRASTETDGKSTDAYEAHVTKSDGTQVEVLLDAKFNVTAVNTRPDHGPGGPGGPDGHGPGDGGPGGYFGDRHR